MPDMFPHESFVIIDDDKDMDNLLPYLVKVDGSVGLSAMNAVQAIDILNKRRYEK